MWIMNIKIVARIELPTSPAFKGETRQDAAEYGI